MSGVVTMFKRSRMIIMSESRGQCRIARQDIPFGSIAAATFYGATQRRNAPAALYRAHLLSI